MASSDFGAGAASMGLDEDLLGKRDPANADILGVRGDLQIMPGGDKGNADYDML